jgi:hypothetical protein
MPNLQPEQYRLSETLPEMDTEPDAAAQAPSSSEATGSVEENASNRGGGAMAIVPATVSSSEPQCDFCERRSAYFPAEIEGDTWIHRGRDNEAEFCTATPHPCSDCGELKTSPECLNCAAIGIERIEREARQSVEEEAKLTGAAESSERRCRKCGHKFCSLCMVSCCECDTDFPNVAALGAGEGKQRDIWDALNQRRGELIDIALSRLLTGEETADLIALQRVAGLVRELVADHPFEVNDNSPAVTEVDPKV